MKIEAIKKIGVIGAGIMGSQISEILSRLGAYEVHMVDVSEELVRRGFEAIDERLKRFFVSKGKLTDEEKKNILDRIKVGTSTEQALKDADFVIEAVVENLALKKDVFQKLDENTLPHAILASNTSLQNISEMAMVTRRPEKVVGTHFFNPVAIMKLVEIVRGASTSDETVEVACALARKLGKETVVCRDISYGFLANRAYIAMVNEAAQMVWERAGSPEEIDKAVMLGMDLPAGPLKVWDATGGWSVLIASEQDAIRELGPEKGRLNPVIRMMARAGYTKIYDFWADVLSKW
jgi:3-hydroxybutyryl-CoA dehydrogenase